MKRLRQASVALLICTLTVSSCANTIRGKGKDIRETGRAVQDTIN